jgi:hypothetical protein
MYDCDVTVLLNIYSYLVFVGEGWLALVPSHLPHLRGLCLKRCDNVCDKYVEELVAAVPELVVISCWGKVVGAMKNEHLESNNCCTSDAVDIMRQCTWPGQSEDCNCHH